MDVSNENLARVALLVQDKPIQSDQPAYDITTDRKLSQQAIAMRFVVSSGSIWKLRNYRRDFGRATTSHACIKEWVLSCRVFGRGVKMPCSAISSHGRKIVTLTY